MNALVSRMAAVATEADWPLGVLFRLSLLLALAWLLHAALVRANPRWRVLLWRASAVAMLVLVALGPLAPAIPLALLPPIATGPPPANDSQTPTPAAAEAPAPDHGPLASDIIHRPTFAGPPAAGGDSLMDAKPAAREPEIPAAVRPWSLVTTLWTIWIFGLVVGLAREAIAVVRIGRLRRRAQVADRAVLAQGAHIAQRIGLRKPFEMLVTRELQTPCVVGLWRPAILLPGGSHPCENDLPAVLSHEIQHLKGADLPWNAVLRGLSRLLWFHPLAWPMRMAHVSACDAVCDAVAADLTGDVSAYCRTLARLALGAGTSEAAIGLAMVPASAARRRIEALNRRLYASGLSRWAMAAVIIGMLAGAGLLGTTRLTRAESGAGDEGPAAGRQQATAKQPASPAAEPAPRAAPASDNDNGSNEPSGQAKEVTLRGVCQSVDSEPVRQCRVRVFRYAFRAKPPKLLGDVQTTDDGTFAIPISADAAWAVKETRLLVVATCPGYASWATELDEDKPIDELPLKMSSDIGTFSGVVTDAAGEPVEGVTIYLPCLHADYIPDFKSSITDAQGRFAIKDLDRWKPKDQETASGGPTFGVTSYAVRVAHPDYALTLFPCTSIPQEAKIVLSPPAVIEGRVVDQVSSEPVPNARICAQGVSHLDWAETQADDAGRYRLLTPGDEFNIWAQSDTHLPSAVQKVTAEAGKTVQDFDIRVQHSGFVVGTVADEATGKPVVPKTGKILRVAHVGPARPRSGASNFATRVLSDGSYRLQVAPGRNYVYVEGGGTFATIDVSEGEEVRLDLRAISPCVSAVGLDDPQSGRAGTQLQEAASSATKRQRSDTPAGRLLDKLQGQNAGSERFREPWLRSLKAIADLGPEAVPELIAELDATHSDLMLRCCAFILRAIDDKRAVPALIRAIPKTLLSTGSDMGLQTEDTALAAWAHQNELFPGSHAAKEYDLGRPVREIFAALHKLTGHSRGEQGLFLMFLGESESQNQIHRGMFCCEARRWADWWEQHATEFVQDAQYTHVNLPSSTATANDSPGGVQSKPGDCFANPPQAAAGDPKDD